MAVVVPVYPSSGRIYVGGSLLVDGIPLQNTAMRHDPKNPMTESSVIELFRQQTNKSVGYIVQIGVPGVLLPLLLSTLIRLIQGSGAVAMITAASITAPMIKTLGVDPIIAGLGCTIGSFMFSYFNDAYFWVVNRSLGVTEVQEQIRVWSVTSTILWAAGSVTLLLINWLFF